MLRNLRIYYLNMTPRSKFVAVAAFLLVVYFWTFSSLPASNDEIGTNEGGRPSLHQGALQKLQQQQQPHPFEEGEEEYTGFYKDREPVVVAPPVKKQDVSGRKLDLALVVLSSGLFNEGTLKARFDKATELYSQLVSKGRRPYVILLPGDAKEAEDKSVVDQLREKLTCGAFDEEDVMLDETSKDLVSGAVRVGEILGVKRISKVTIVTSDYNVLRTQYIFGTALPSKVEMTFVGVPTEDRETAQKQDNPLFAQAQADLERYGVINVNETFGYHPVRNIPRWRMIEHELEIDLRADKSLLQEPFYMMDYGSNYGYFSLQMAKKFQNGLQVSLEGEAWQEYKGAAGYHKKKMEEMGVTNNVLCNTKTQPTAFKALQASGQVYQYQLCLSIFHWFYMPDRSSFEEALFNHLSNARTTFLELPEARVYTGREGQHAWDWVNRWYAGRDEVTVITDVLQKNGLNTPTQFRVKVLGALMHDNKTIRKMIRVDLLENQPQGDLDTILRAYGCTPDKVFQNTEDEDEDEDVELDDVEDEEMELDEEEDENENEEDEEPENVY